MENVLLVKILSMEIIVKNVLIHVRINYVLHLVAMTAPSPNLVFGVTLLVLITVSWIIFQEDIVIENRVIVSAALVTTLDLNVNLANKGSGEKIVPKFVIRINAIYQEDHVIKKQELVSIA
jgi:hypothetical protein